MVGNGVPRPLEMCVDISNYARYACGPLCPTPDWCRVTDIVGYMEKLKRGTRGPTRQVGCLV